MKVAVIAWTNLLRTLRDRMGLFFIVILPLILIVVLGMTYGGMGAARIGVTDLDGGPLAEDLVDGVATMDMDVIIRRYDTVAELRDAVERGYVEVGLAIPAGYDAALRAGETATIDYLAQAKSIASVVRTNVDSAIADQQAAVRAARFAATESGITFDQAFAAARDHATEVPGVDVALETIGSTGPSVSGFTLGAHSQVVLFIFLTSLTGAVPLVQTRQLGISRRMFSTPTSARTIIAGEALGRFALAMFQGLFIVVASGLFFGVDWGNPLGTGAVILVFGLAATGAAMLIGAWAKNESQVGSIGVAAGLLLALLGGTMVPLEVFPSIMRTVGHATPHAWAMDAFAKMRDEGAGLAEILPQVGVLLAFAAVLLALAVLRFRRTLVSGGA
jgi:ABC-2 type transport system permease protein